MVRIIKEHRIYFILNERMIEYDENVNNTKKILSKVIRKVKRHDIYLWKYIDSAIKDLFPKMWTEDWNVVKPKQHRPVGVRKPPTENIKKYIFF